MCIRDRVPTLPDINKFAVHATEWKYRKISAERILKYLERTKAENILELGCGNGWFANLISKRKKSITVGVDINETELIQAARLFSKEHTLFVYGDIFETVWPTNCFDIIILNSSLQYFPYQMCIRDRPYILQFLIKYSPAQICWYRKTISIN